MRFFLKPLIIDNIKYILLSIYGNTEYYVNWLYSNRQLISIFSRFVVNLRITFIHHRVQHKYHNYHHYVSITFFYLNSTKVADNKIIIVIVWW